MPGQTIKIPSREGGAFDSSTMSATPRSRRICEPMPISTWRRSASAFLGRLRSALWAIHSETDLGRRSRISTITPRPSSAMARSEASEPTIA